MKLQIKALNYFELETLQIIPKLNSLRIGGPLDLLCLN